MMHRALLAMTLSAILIVSGLFGCEKSTDNPSLPIGPGFEVGFWASEGMGMAFAPLPIQHAVKSEYSLFNMNNVALDLYYGSNGNLDGLMYNDRESDCEFVCYSLFFGDVDIILQIDNDPDYAKRGDGLFSDYHLSGGYFIKELSLDEFNSVEYSFKIFNNRIEINHHEVVIVPTGVFAKESGTFYFRIVSVHFSEKHNGYYVLPWGRAAAINYERIDEQTVRLSAHSG